TARAGNLVRHHVPEVTLETVIIQDAGLTVAFVTKRVGIQAFRSAVGRFKLSLQQRSVDRAMRTARTRSTRAGALVVVVTIGAGDDAAGGVGGKQARHVRVAPRSRDGMKGGVVGPERK